MALTSPMPIALFAYTLLCPPTGCQNFGNGTASTLAWCGHEVAPTGVSTSENSFSIPEAVKPLALVGESLGWMDLSVAVFGKSRELVGWESDALDKFTWAELES